MADTTDDVKQKAKSAVLDGEDLRQAVRDITLQALQSRKLDHQNIRAVVEAVLAGVSGGLQQPWDKARDDAARALHGVDDALQKAAQAAKLATEEAIGRGTEFSDHDLRAAIDELSTLESMFLETVKVVASQSSGVVADIFNDLGKHLKATGTQAGGQAKEAVNSLYDILSSAGRDGVANLTVAGKHVGEQLAHIAAGFLGGMAEAIAPKKK
ncbi:MAG: hypothetical protein OEW58_08120 [Gammaproteobacteria bacterium]|nr:hypothetical protein [Gammaproteobacteria bacterium]